MLAARSDKVEAVELLLQYLADKTIQNRKGKTAIELASSIDVHNIAIMNILSGKFIILKKKFGIKFNVFI